MTDRLHKLYYSTYMSELRKRRYSAVEMDKRRKRVRRILRGIA